MKHDFYIDLSRGAINLTRQCTRVNLNGKVFTEFQYCIQKFRKQSKFKSTFFFLGSDIFYYTSYFLMQVCPISINSPEKLQACIIVFIIEFKLLIQVSIFFFQNLLNFYAIS